MKREFLHFGPFHKELRGTIESILIKSDGELSLDELKLEIKKRKGCDLQETRMTYEEVQRRNLTNLFRYKDGTVYLN